MIDLGKCTKGKGPGTLYAAFALLAAGLITYSQIFAFHWDEGFHILTAHLIAAGKRPYVDFFFPQTPLNAYWNAAWMGIFGQNWRVVHAVAALATVGSVLLIAQYLFALFPEPRWRPAIAFASLALFGLNSLVWEFGCISQAYAFCLLLLVAGFRTSIAAAVRRRPWMSMLAGVFCGAAAASSLLTAAASPVLLIWIWLNNRAGNRWNKVAGFIGGAAAAWSPVLFLFALGPHQAIFNIVQYHLIYRRIDWERPTAHDIDVATIWINNSLGLLVVLLALAGLFSIKKLRIIHARRSELRLCFWLALAIGGQNLTAHPTFAQYFIFLIPFLTVLAAIGFYIVSVRLANPDRPRGPAIAILCIAALCLGRSLYDQDADSFTWSQLVQIADKVKQVTPQGAALFAPEQIYFLAHWPVPSGMEFAASRKLKLAPAENARLHILPKEDADRRIKAGDFSTAVVCDDDQVKEMEGWDLYSEKADFGECTIFWQLGKKPAQPQPRP